MKSTGIVRNIDELGRIVIPKEIRDRMDIKNSDPVEFYVEDNKIILTKYEPSCLFCHRSVGMTNFRGRNICIDCLRELKRI